MLYGGISIFKKAFIIGFSVAAVLTLLGIFTKNLELYGSITLGIGIVFVVISGLLGGVFATPDQLRANYHSENKEDRRKRSNVLLVSATIAVPNLLLGFLLLYFN
ncbi:DUF5316 family protein [Ornithinibacillus salinisoli]|uniref:DUF5316 family protein n=1 Tax=Ornithinibacillus salinisoli TaxID=1848459 RepID=A0ABW4VT73_9BACI